MKATRQNPQQPLDVVIVEDGEDRVHVWLDENGLHSQRIGVRRKHAVETLPWDKVIAKTEGQKLLPL